jgi:hypothetical protein
MCSSFYFLLAFGSGEALRETGNFSWSGLDTSPSGAEIKGFFL